MWAGSATDILPPAGAGLRRARSAGQAQLALAALMSLRRARSAGQAQLALAAPSAPELQQTFGSLHGQPIAARGEGCKRCSHEVIALVARLSVEARKRGGLMTGGQDADASQRVVQHHIGRADKVRILHSGLRLHKPSTPRHQS